MTTYLFSISIGPVQEFIAAARRTADLRAGSQLLQHLAKHVAQEVEKAGGKLIFPANTNVPGPNKVLAEIATDQPSEIAERLRESAVQWLHEEWQQVHARLKSAGVAVIDDLAQGQISHFLEFYAAWVPLEGDYTAARERVEALLAGRKALRDFSQPASVHGIPKSPLDPSRDCALLLNRKGSSYSVPESAQRLPSLRLKKTEFLDAVSLLKRAQDARDVPSTSLMAAQSILPLAEKRVPEAVQTLRTVAQSSQGAVDVGDLMFPSRLQEEMSEVPALQEQKERVERARRDILTSVGLSECPAYYAILAADGDRMGKLISAQNTVDEHRQLSEAVAEVAKQMTEAIHQHNGYCVYAGGDDVLALLPVNQALECATKLARLFREAMITFAVGEGSGTLSVGVAIAHHLESLQRAVGWARSAEERAKEKRNALGVALHPRGGASVSVVTQWKEDSNNVPQLEGWTVWIEAFRRGLSHGFPYELLHLAREAEGCNLEAKHLREEALRIFRRKQGRGAQGVAAPLRDRLEERLKQMDGMEDLKRLARLLIIARFLSRYPEVSA